MKTTFATWAILTLAAAVALADGVPQPATIEASFDGARLADELSGTLTDPTKEIRIRLYASAGSNLTATLTPAPDAQLVLNPTLTLCDDAGVPVDVTAYDKTVPGSGGVAWKRVPLTSTGGWSLILRGAGSGGWTLKLRGALAKVAASASSTTDLGVGVETQVDFHGLKGGTVAFTLAPVGKSKFRGELVRVERPDGSSIDGTTATAKGRVVLDADGVHRLVFRNAGDGIGAWTAKTTVSPPRLVPRRGFVSPAATAFVPVVLRATPTGGFYKDDAALVTLTGRDFQPGADVRLVRNGFEDIVATDVVVDSETQIRCTLNLDTAPVTGRDSLGKWRIGVWNLPTYATPGDPKTLDKTSPANDRRRTFNSLAASSIDLPPGVIKDTEVWQLAFVDDFQTDLNLMGLGSSDAETARVARNAVEAYVVCFVRDLMRANETNGKLVANASPAVSFVVGRVPTPGGRAGRDFNRIEIGGAWTTGDERDVSETLLWGFAPLDPTNAHLDDLSVEVDDGSGGKTRVGRGVRTRVLDPTAGTANADWAAAMQPLRSTPLTASDRGYFSAGFGPTNVATATRYRDIVNQVTRASREIAAIVAHQIGRAMGLATGGAGPMDAPTSAGYLWPTTSGLDFSETDIATLRANAKPTVVFGKSKTLTIRYFPLISTQASYLPNLTTATPYSVAWNYVGGRANAVKTDYTVKYTGGNPTIGIAVNFDGLSGTAPLYIDATQGLFYATISYFRVTVTDTLRGGSAAFLYRLNVLPNVPLLRPGQEQNNATIARNTILSTP